MLRCLVLMLALPAVARAADFRTDVMAVLSRAGCNQGACHGNANGKGGFKLSLRGEDATADYNAIVRDQFGRRCNALTPDESLLLLKSGGRLPHEGGVRFSRSSPEYKILRDWIGAGMPDAPTPALRELTVSPGEAIVVAPTDRVALKAVAHFADGATLDVTSLCTFELGMAGIATVDGSGLVTRIKPGSVPVLVRFLDRQVPVMVSFVPDRAAAWPADAVAENVIDETVFARLRRLHVAPSGRVDDATFLRRVFLDTLGILPTVDEARAFLADPATDKRARLIDRLLRRPEFDEFWAQKWSDVLHNEERTLDAKGVSAYYQWFRKQSADNVTLPELARAVIAGRGSTYADPPANFYRALREPYARAEAVAQAFLGIRIQCAKCHNHPFDRWTQDDYHSFAALFSRVNYRVVENRRTDPNDHHAFIGEQIVFESPVGELKHPRDGAAVVPRLLGEARAVPPDARLQTLADWMADPANPFFARTQVNRIWYHFFGRGIVEPSDDFRLANPPAHPELLAALTAEFRKTGGDLRHIVRLILNSRVYQSSSTANEPNSDDASFARSLVQPLEAEQLLDAIGQALGRPAKFDNYPAGLRAGQIPELPAPSRRKESDAARFLRLFGKPDRLLGCECERTEDATVVQAAQLLTGDIVQKAIAAPEGRLTALMTQGKSDTEIVETLYLAALSRYPTDAERSAAGRYLHGRDRRAALEDFAWSLLNTKEFLLRR
ncbi:MAG: DUF1549 and DUF1553 domain-containing protein [Gemmataceae bacterium]|nr:DUF1549 and DUF1553 domain-containing protein [Gemmataceae bacterium]